MNYWLLKSEPETYSIDALKRDRVTGWTGVRNYQARNFLRAMKRGDLALFYHSNATPPGVAGVCRVAKEAYPDPEQFVPKSEYYDEKATSEAPRWFCPDVEFVKKLPRLIPLEELRGEKKLAGMILLQRGSRLSVTPVTKGEFEHILSLVS